MSTPTIADLQNGLKDFQGLVKLIVPFVPGADNDAKAAAIDGVIDPLVDNWLQDHGTPAPLVSFVNTSIDWIVAAELKAASA